MAKSLFFVFLSFLLFSIYSVYGADFYLPENNFSQNYSKEIPTETIDVKITPHRKNALFDEHHPVKYNVSISNFYKQTQEGKVSIEIKTATGNLVTSNEIDFKIKAGAKKNIDYAIPVQDPGFYDIYVRLNLTDYDDTIRRVFGYRPYEINTPLHKPDDFEAFWQKAQDDLKAVNPDYSITPDDILSTPTHQVYLVEMSSLDNVRIYGWLTVPRVRGKFPIIYSLGGYRVEMHPGFYDDFICFTLNTRGIGESIQVINPNHKEQIVLNIEDKNKYVYRGIYMDCLRGLDFILTNKDFGFDISRIGCFGASQGGTLALIVASFSKNISFCVIDNPMFCDFRTNYDVCIHRKEPEYFIRTLRDFLQKNSSITKDKLMKTLSYFELQNFIPQIHSPILLGGGLLDLLAPPTCTLSAFNKLSPEVKSKSEANFFPTIAHDVDDDQNVLKAIWFSEKSIKRLAQKQ